MVFENLEERNVVSWNIVISTYAKQRAWCNHAIRMFQAMLLEGTKPEAATFLAVLEACATMEGLGFGRWIHAMVRETPVRFQVHTALINMYGKCGCPEEALEVFEGLLERQTVAWNNIIGAFSLQGYLREALGLFHDMQLQGVLANHATFLNLLNGCTSFEDLPHGETIRGYVENTEYAGDIVLETSVVNMYSRCGKLDGALDDVDMASSSTMVAALVKYGWFSQALYFLRRMQLSGVRPNLNSLISGLNACTSPRSLRDGMTVHSWIAELGLEKNMIVETALFTMYGKCSSLESARTIFESMSEKDIVSWNTMLTLYNARGCKDEGLGLFRRMQHEGLGFNRFTLSIVLGAVDTVSMVELIWAMVSEGEYHGDEGLLTLLVGAYGKFGQLDRARTAFDRIKHRTVASWAALISAYVEHGRLKEAMKMFQGMQLEGAAPNGSTISSIFGECGLGIVQTLHDSIRNTVLEMDTAVCNALIQAYGGHGRVTDARSVFEKTPEKSPMSWSTMIEAYLEHGPREEGLLLYHRMLLEGMVPDPVILVAALGTCASMATLRHGRAVHAQAVEVELDMELFVATALVNMFGKCGALETAEKIFDKVVNRDVIVWNAMMASYAQHGTYDQVVRLLRRMEQEGAKAGKVTFISVFAALSHAGLVEKAMDYFSLMIMEYEIAPSLEHYGCLVDLLGRAGKVAAAESLIRTSSSEGASRLWMTLLGACKGLDDMDRGKRAAKNAVVLDPRSSASYVALSNMYACLEE